MTAVTFPAKGDHADLRAVPWRRMAWVTWRQHRLTIAAATALLGVVALFLWLAGISLHHAYSNVTNCHPRASDACTTALNNFAQTYDRTANIIPALLQALPALIGAFVGAPILARELETGTFRYAWTQGFGRWRWTLAKLLTLGITVTAAAGLFTVLFSWYYRPFLADHQATPLTATVFDLRGIDFAVWTLTAFAIGAAAGILTRRVVPAISATLTAYVALAILTAIIIRPHYQAPVVTNQSHIPASGLVTNTWGTKNGLVVYTGQAPGDLVERYCPPLAIGSGKPTAGSLTACLTHHGYTTWTSYQPANRFWTFQLIEASWLIALSILLIAGAIVLVRLRAA